MSRQCVAGRLLTTLALASGACGATPLRGTQTAPLELVLPRLGGGEIDVASLRGRPVLLTFFATWSLQTDYELDQVTRVVQAEDDRVAVIAIGVDTDLVPMYVEAAGLRLPVALLSPEVRDGGSALGRISAIPRTVLLDVDGRIRDDRVGRVPAEVLVREVEALLADR